MNCRWLAVLLLVGCGASTPGNAWQARIPVYLDVAVDVPADPVSVKLSLANGLAQFGFMTSTSAWGQTLNVRYDAKCHCKSCATGQVQNLATTAAYVSQAEYQTIYVCPAFAKVAHDFGLAGALDMVVKHELGHALGLVKHLEPATGVLMSAQIDWRPTVRSFGPTDIAQICAAGGVRSPVCD
jgi:hypothetical protein